MKVALLQLNASDNPAENLPVTRDFVEEAASAGARFILTPEVTNCVSTSRSHQKVVLQSEAEDITLSRLRQDAERLGVWVLIGSLALVPDHGERFVNRSFLIGPDGGIRARYDKIHMFDVDVSEKETYHESDGFRPGDEAVLTHVDDVPVGLTICYDVRFPYLYRGLSKAGAKVLTVPAAFTPETGAAHWETLLRARGIETGSYILAPAQCGTHKVSRGKTRSTHGHSLVIDPWGRVLVDGGSEPGVNMVELDLDVVDDVRRRLPSLSHERTYKMA